MAFDWLDFVAGYVGGAAGVVVAHPFDTVKVRLQTDTQNVYRASALLCVNRTVTADGALALFRGVTSPLLGLGAINAVLFGVQGNMARALFVNTTSASSIWVSAMAAGAAQSVIASPMELAKIALQMEQGRGASARFTNPAQCLWYLYRTRGFFRGVMKGYGITLCRDIPAYGAYFYVYEVLVHWLSPGTGEFDLGAEMVSGAIAGCASWLSCYPIDVIKSRLQYDGISGQQLYRSWLHCAQMSYRQEGMRIFARGLPLTLIRAVPSNAVTFATVSGVKHLWGRYSSR